MDSSKIFSDKVRSRELKLLVDKGVVIVDGPLYIITEYGKYLITTTKLGISFLSLCALSEIYVMQSNFSNPRNGSYPVTRFCEKLETVYSQDRLRKAATSRLKNKGYVCKKSSKKVYIPHPMYLKLKKHDLVLRNLQKWFVKTCDKINDIVNNDPNIKKNIKNNSF